MGQLGWGRPGHLLPVVAAAAAAAAAVGAFVAEVAAAVASCVIVWLMGPRGMGCVGGPAA